MKPRGRPRIRQPKRGEKMQCTLRLDGALVAWLDDYAAQLSRPGLPITFTDACSVLLHEAMERHANKGARK